jgi:hypothetical protein
MKCSRLDDNDLTFIHVKLYIDAYENRSPLMSVGNCIQKRQLQDHLDRNCLEGNQQVCLDWIEKNSKPLRCYLNSLTIFSEFLWIDMQVNFRKGLVREIFSQAVKIFNENLEYLEQVRIEDKI